MCEAFFPTGEMKRAYGAVFIKFAGNAVCLEYSDNSLARYLES
jgi:hypothetical protein